jgi:hypothetical protein
MHTPEVSVDLELGSEEQLPLALPHELWSSLSPGQKSIYRRAQTLIGVLEPVRRASITSLIDSGPRGEVLRALEMLERMDLILLETDDSGLPIVHLVAVPSDHVAIVGPDRQRRWVFIAQPLDPPAVASHLLN